MKEKYIRPFVKVVHLSPTSPLLVGTFTIESAEIETSQLSRESSIWDDDEKEEDNLGGWFK